MTEERITETTDSSGNTHTTHTVVTDGANRGGGTNWVLIMLVVAIAIIGIFFFTQMNSAEVAKDNAIADAANEVGEAANQVGDAAQNAGEAVEDAVAN
ncbi:MULTISPECIES: hypothetical protein [unclassified Erythrobacter]|uniref:hypothetical protein n=1 Tax=unclassified Erythrobacter TaxID=2633097 RepID=UPI00076CDEF5|nr:MULTISPECIES: hypothetical protein [unclassified Erythrobacter]KWV95851.1 hypothetical protein ASS64_01050 [Erythrobacter sp. AP23]MBO6526838.1 hypothetical protein [Erythrobacter sp.]MBO6528511.1 hypothetical protein [Erythrobacter sp.]